MPATKSRLTVELEDGTTWDVTADQRDVAKFELQDFYAPDRIRTMVRFIAWNASQRQDLTKLGWPKFDQVCVDVSGAADEEPDVDPTQPDQSTGS